MTKYLLSLLLAGLTTLSFGQTPYTKITAAQVKMPTNGFTYATGADLQIALRNLDGAILALRSSLPDAEALDERVAMLLGQTVAAQVVGAMASYTEPFFKDRSIYMNDGASFSAQVITGRTSIAVGAGGLTAGGSLTTGNSIEADLDISAGQDASVARNADVLGTTTTSNLVAFAADLSNVVVRGGTTLNNVSMNTATVDTLVVTGTLDAPSIMSLTKLVGYPIPAFIGVITKDSSPGIYGNYSTTATTPVAFDAGVYTNSRYVLAVSNITTSVARFTLTNGTYLVRVTCVASATGFGLGRAGDDVAVIKLRSNSSATGPTTYMRSAGGDLDGEGTGTPILAFDSAASSSGDVLLTVSGDANARTFYVTWSCAGTITQTGKYGYATVRVDALVTAEGEL